MKKIMILFAFLLAISIVSAQKSGPYTLVTCTDTDDDNPNSQGIIEWAYTDSAGYGSNRVGDVCSEIHYLNVLMYAGEDFELGEAVLVEGICPPDGTVVDEPGNFAVAKYYKCECENIGEGGEKGTENNIGICTDTAEEIPYETVKAADDKWMKSGKKDLHPLLVRFLNLLGLWG
jgi:hypothetical protein